MKHRIIYMGTPEFAVAPLKKLKEEGFDIAAVVTVPDKPAGRGLKLNESAVKKFALEQGLEVLQPVSLKDEAFLAKLASYGADLFIVVAFRMLPKAVWSMPEMGTFNLHASLLPQYRGAAPINWAVINGEKESGVTTFLIDEQIDTGNILLQKSCPLSGDETVGTLYDKLMELGAGLVVETVRGLYNGSLQPEPQALFIREGTEIKPAPKITKELCHICWERSAEEILRLVRGLSPYPGTFSHLSNGEKNTEFKIYGAELDSGAANTAETPGTIISDNKNYLKVHCGSGILKLTEVQAAGKRRMAVREFLAGFREINSYKFE